MDAGTRRARGSRQGRRPVEEAIVDGALELGLQTDEDRERLAQVFADSYAAVLVDALERLARGADPVAAVRAALAAAEGGAS